MHLCSGGGVEVQRGPRSDSSACLRCLEYQSRYGSPKFHPPSESSWRVAGKDNFVVSVLDYTSNKFQPKRKKKKKNL